MTLTKQQFMAGILVLEDSLPDFVISDKKNTLQNWYEMLKDLSPEVWEHCIRMHLATCKFKPTVAHLREYAEKILNPVSEMTPDQAWQEVTAAIRKNGSYKEQEALESMSPITRDIVKAMGYKLLCLSEDQMADRAHFLKMFEQYKSRERHDHLLPAGMKEQQKQLASSIKLLAEGMAMK